RLVEICSKHINIFLQKTENNLNDWAAPVLRRAPSNLDRAKNWPCSKIHSHPTGAQVLLILNFELYAQTR
ncbi:MAG: hypothetical protein ABIP71_07340, partial [Verrucomicrobiota bacterium]